MQKDHYSDSEEGDDVRKSVRAKTSGSNNQYSYGAISFENAAGGKIKTVINDLHETSAGQALSSRLAEWGGPEVLLVFTWIALVATIAPVCWIAATHLQVGFFEINCMNMAEMFTFPRLICDISQPGLYMFPPVSILLCLGLASYSLLKQRLWYVCLKNGLFVDFVNRPHVFVWAVGWQCFLFALGIVHLFFAIQNKTDTTTGEEAEPLVSPEEGFFWFFKFIGDPRSLQDPDNANLQNFLRVALLEYVLPCIWCIIFTFKVGDVEQGLLPISKLFNASSEQDVTMSGELLSVSVAVEEKVLREILTKCQSQETDIGRRMTSQKNMTDAMTLLRKECLTFEGAYMIGGGDIDLESKTERKQVTVPELGFWDLLCKRWWPLEILMKESATEYADDHFAADRFRWVWGCHCVMSFALVVVMAAWRIQAIEGYGQQFHRYPVATFVIGLTLHVPIFGACAMLLWAFGSSACNNLLLRNGKY